MTIPPVLAQLLQRRECRQAAVHRDFRRLVAGQAALEDEDPVLAWRQIQAGEDGIDLPGIREKQRRFRLGRRRALADDGLVRPLARQQAQRAEQDALARARLTGDGREPRLEIERHLLEEGEIPDAERLQHGGYR